MMPRAAISFVLLTILLAGCAGPPPVQTAPADAQVATTIYEKAEAYRRNEFLDKATERYLSIIEVYPDSGAAPLAARRLAEIYESKNQPEKAAYYLEWLIAHHPDIPDALEAHFDLARQLQKLGRYKDAAGDLNYYVSVDDAKRKSEAQLLLGFCLANLSQPGDAVVAFAATGNSAARAGQVEVLKQVRVLVDEKLSLGDLLTILPRLGEGAITDFVRFRAAERLVAEHRNEDAARLIKEINFSSKKYKFYDKAEKLLEVADAASAPEPAPTPAEPIIAEEPIAAVGAPDVHRAVALLLPLSGPRAVFGNEVLHGFMQGAGLFSRGKSHYRVLVRDTKGDPDTAAALVAELADDPEVLAIVGPLLGPCADAAAPIAQARGIPLVTLTTREDITEVGDWVFRNFLTPRMQVETLVNYATRNQGVLRFAILYPENKRGRGFRDLFVQAVDPARYVIAATASYDPAETDFRVAIQSLQRQGDFQALFIPDSARESALLAPQLVYYGVRDVMLLGTNSWNNDELIRRASAYLDRAVFVDGFFAASTQNAVVEPFVVRFHDTFHHRPSFLAAVGFDTARVFDRLLRRSEIGNRDAVRRALLDVHGFPGVTGDLTVGEDRDVFRHLYLLRVNESRIDELF